MTPIVSILLPTIRPDLFRIRMQEYAQLQLPGPCEVVVVSDRPDLLDAAPQPGLSVQYLVQPRGGNVPATNLAFAAAQGTYVLATNDEVAFEADLLTALVRAAALQVDGIFSPVQTPYCSNDYYGVFFANCPFGRRRFFQHLNGQDCLFDPVYRCFYADPDLSLRAAAQGLAVVMVPDARCAHQCVPGAEGHVANARAYYAQDRQTFVTRWAHLGPPPIDPSVRES